VVLTLAKCFDPESVRPSVLCLSDGLLLRKLEEAGIESFLIPMKSKRDIFGPVTKAIRIIKKEKMDIVHTHTVRSNLVGRLAAVASGRKCVTHLHSPVSRDFADLRRGRINEFIDSLTRPAASLYIAVSDSLKGEMIKKGMPRDKIVTVHNALDLESLAQSAKEDAGIRKEYNIPEDAFVLVMVALLRPRKGADLLIQAMKKVLKQSPNAYLLLVGSDDISEEPGHGRKLRELAHGLGMNGNVIFTGFRDNIQSIMKECDLMVLPSRFGEGLPMVILEAMAAGLPVVASRVEGVPEVIEDGVNGFLVDPGDVEELSENIINAMRNPHLLRDVAKSAGERVSSDHNGYVQARKIEELYRKLLSCRNP